MARIHWSVVAFGVLVSAMLFWRGRGNSDGDSVPFEPPSRLMEPSPLCPWREPESDLRRFFPGANRSKAETRILSGLRVELAKQLGRQPDAAENTLTLHRIYQDSRSLGSILTRRVKGEYGAIEIVLAVTSRGAVQGARLQRLREPATISAVLQDGEWLKAFHGRTHKQGWESDDLRGLPPEARSSAQAIRDGVRSLLILFAAAEHSGSASVKPHH